jgi:hypothetical protein
MLVCRGLRWPCVVVGLVVSAGLVTGCGSSTANTSGNNHQSVPSNVTVRESPETARLPASLLTTSGELADLVDFHEGDFSGSWFETSDAKLHIGVATRAGRGLLDERGLLDNSIGWATLPQGDGIDLFVHSDHLTPDQLEELGDLPCAWSSSSARTEGRSPDSLPSTVRDRRDSDASCRCQRRSCR